MSPQGPVRGGHAGSSRDDVPEQGLSNVPGERVGTSTSRPSSRRVADVEPFITMLRAACEDPGMQAVLEKLLSMPDDRRRNMVHNWVSDMLIKQAPSDLVQAIACLSDDAVAQKAYQVIFRGSR